MSGIMCRSCGKAQKSVSQMKNIFTNSHIHDAIFNLTLIKVKLKMFFKNSKLKCFLTQF